MTVYMVATTKPWNIAAFEAHRVTLPGSWHLVEQPENLTAEVVERLSPRYIFFPHWSWKVPDDVLGAAECICFHMTDVPYGRGGSPLQNLIQRGHKETVISALRMTREVDAGPVYLKRPLDLAGRAQDIFERLSGIIFWMIGEIVEIEPEPVQQSGEPVVFRRRTPDQSVLPMEGGASDIYDHIRMLDAETYPRAFLKHGAFRLVFSKAELRGDGTLEAKVKITHEGGGR